jgi:hypothetical protein
MYILNPLEIAHFDVANANSFVEFWSQFYDDSITVFESKDKIDYLSELNLGNDLTEENVRRLLRWKDETYLTKKILSGPNRGEDNPRVLRVLGHLSSINQFRNDKSTEDDARGIAKQVFPNGVIWQAFLLHIAKPHVYPIADKNVFRTFSLHAGIRVKENWKGYVAYCDYFNGIARAIGISRTIRNILQLKRIDNALMVFGQFLRAYYPEGSTSAQSADPGSIAIKVDKLNNRSK